MSNSVAAKSCIVLAFDRLGANYLGPYGNSWHETTAFNRLAGQSIVYERMVADSTDRELVLRSLWTGIHAASNGVTQGKHLADIVGSSGGASLLISDDVGVCNSELASKFDRAIQIEVPSVSELAADATETQLAYFFAQTIQLLNQIQPGDFCWIQCGGVARAWDAPFEFRKRLTGPEDPAPSTSVEPPSGSFDSEQNSPDDQLALQVAYAAQVSIVDEMTGVFLDQLNINDVTANGLFACIGLAGYPLGEHGEIGPASSLFNESVHVPCFVRQSIRQPVHARRLALSQPSDLYQVIGRYFDSGDSKSDHERSHSEAILPNRNRLAAISVSPDFEMIETHAWKFIRSDDSKRLFVRPDDRWEVNDVYNRCESIADELEVILDCQLEKMRTGQTNVTVELEEHLAFSLS